MLLFQRIQVQFPASTLSSSQMLVTSAAGAVIWSTWANFHTNNETSPGKQAGAGESTKRWASVATRSDAPFGKLLSMCFCFGFCGRGFLVMQTDLEFSDLHVHIMTAWPKNG